MDEWTDPAALRFFRGGEPDRSGDDHAEQVPERYARMERDDWIRGFLWGAVGGAWVVLLAVTAVLCFAKGLHS